MAQSKPSANLSFNGRKLGGLVFANKKLTITFTNLEPNQIILLRAHAHPRNEILPNVLKAKPRQTPQSEIELSPGKPESFSFVRHSNQQKIVLVATPVDGTEPIFTSEPFVVHTRRTFYNRKHELTPSSTLRNVPGIGRDFWERLQACNTSTVQQLADCTFAELADLHGRISKTRSRLKLNKFVEMWHTCRAVCNRTPTNELLWTPALDLTQDPANEHSAFSFGHQFANHQLQHTHTQGLGSDESWYFANTAPPSVEALSATETGAARTVAAGTTMQVSVDAFRELDNLRHTIPATTAFSPSASLSCAKMDSGFCVATDFLDHGQQNVMPWQLRTQVDLCHVDDFFSTNSDPASISTTTSGAQGERDEIESNVSHTPVDDDSLFWAGVV